jgi:hypothetical protein
MKKMYSMEGRYLSIFACFGLAMVLLGTTPSKAQVAPALGVAGNFAVLGGSAVTNTGNTIIVGDLGVSPGTSVSGFPPGIVTGGSIRINDGIAQQGHADLQTAYNFLAGQPFNTDLTSQNLGGMTLLSGVYRFSSSAQLTGTLTLDANSNPNAVFIFQVGSTLTTASNAQVLMINGGSYANVFWQVGSSATIGIAGAFAGDILALASITFATGATTTGRALALNGAVTLDNNQLAANNGGGGSGCNPITLSPAMLPPGILGLAYNQTMTASGGIQPYAFEVISGMPPTGLILSPSGILSGIPLATGVFTFTVRTTDVAGCPGSRVYTMLIDPAGCPPISVSPETLPPMTAGITYGQAISANGGTGPYTYDVTMGELPQGMTLYNTGLLSGTVAIAGTYTFTITATDALFCTGSRVYTLQVNHVPAAIPTLSEWGLIILGFFLLGFGTLYIVRRNG